jgi:N-acetylglutamate synthase-like GNAT family acetyltransferase
MQNILIPFIRRHSMVVIREATSIDEPMLAHRLVTFGLADSIKSAQNAIVDEQGKGNRFFLIEKDGVMIGFVTVHVPDAPYNGAAELHVEVMPTSNSEGIAAEIFTLITETLKDHFTAQGISLKTIYLVAPADDARARAFYEAMGLEPEEIDAERANHTSDVMYAAFFA